MGKFFYYLGRVVQATGLLLMLNVLIVSGRQNGSMGFLFKFAVLGMGIFMVGWFIQQYS